MGSLLAGATVDALGVALDATTMRQMAIAHNIANGNTPGYRPVEVSFESHLEQARAQLAQGRPLSAAALANAYPRLEYLRGGTGASGSVELDMETAKLSQTVLHHQELLKLLGKHFALLNAAMTPIGGR
jgi:flagellar basal-body rod protein FlgB